MTHDDRPCVPVESQPPVMDRRTVNRAMAWSTPVVLVAASSPRAAASMPPVVVYEGGDGTRIVGDKKVAFALRFLATAPATVVISAVTPDNGWQTLPVVLSVAPGPVTCAFALSRTNNATGVYTIVYSVNGGPAQTGVVVIH